MVGENLSYYIMRINYYILKIEVKRIVIIFNIYGVMCESTRIWGEGRKVTDDGTVPKVGFGHQWHIFLKV